MASGGYRPGAGRKKGTKNTKPKKPSKSRKPANTEKQKLEKMLALDKKAKASFYQEYLQRVSKGERLTIQEKKLMNTLGIELAAGLNEDDKTEAKAENLDPLAYMLRVMNDPVVDVERRDKMAIASAPFIHSRKGEGNKKEDRDDRAKKAGQGKFKPMRAPTLKAVK